MNKQIKIIIILASILVVLVAGNIIIKKVTKFNSEKARKKVKRNRWLLQLGLMITMNFQQ